MLRHNSLGRTVWQSTLRIPHIHYAHRVAARKSGEGDSNVESNDLYERYLTSVTSPTPPMLSKLSQFTEQKSRRSHQMVHPSQGRLLYHLVRLQQPRRILEIGCYTGYSAIWMALGLGEQALLKGEPRIWTCEVDADAASIAQGAFKENGIQDLIVLKHGPAIESLRQFPVGMSGIQFDFVFLDADKSNYITYYYTIMNRNLLSQHGVIIADNVLFRDEVYLDEPPGATSRHMRAFNEHVANDPRVEQVVLPLFDGISIIQRKQKLRCPL